MTAVVITTFPAFLIVDVATVDAVVIDTRVLILTFDFLETSMFTVIGVQWFLKLSG